MKKKILLIVGIVIGLIGVIGITFALWNKTFVQGGENIVESDCFEILFHEQDRIFLEYTFPMYDEDGMKLTPYTFTIENKCNNEADYQVNFEIKNTTTLKDEYVKFQFQEEEPVLLNTLEPTSVTISNGKNAYKLEEGRLKAREKRTYQLRIWMYDKVTQDSEGAMNSLFEGVATVRASYIHEYKENILDGNDPVIKEPLIPVTITNEEGQNVVKRADLNSEWYKYADHRWANAVILKDENANPAEGATITEDEIESYFVWIPKFDYVIFSTTNYSESTNINSGWNANEHAIQIRFREESTTDTDSECKSPNKSGDIGTCEVGKWMTHPAFVDGFEGIRGMWVGKFETSHNASTGTNETNSEAIQIKPNITSWRNVQVANAFYSVYNYKRDLDSHMMKNTEWGAAAYLTHSVYGRCSSATSCEEVRYNNHEGYLTGYASVNAPTIGYTGTSISCVQTPSACNEYGTTSDVTRPWNDVKTLGLASTTGNLSGIYDISGGANDYVMGVMVSRDEQLISGTNANRNSNFNGFYTAVSGSKSNGVNYPEDSKYYDLYNYAENDKTYGRMILGDATGEMGPFGLLSNARPASSWYQDEAWFIYTEYPWFSRGYLFNHGVGSGVFAFEFWMGEANDSHSFRVVLSPMNT